MKSSVLIDGSTQVGLPPASWDPQPCFVAFEIFVSLCLRDRSFFMRWGGGGWWDLGECHLEIA